MKPKFNKKAIVLTLGLAALVLPLDAQVVNQGRQPYMEPIGAGGMFMRQPGGVYYICNEQVSDQNGGFFIHPQTFFDGENYGYNLNNGTFEDVTPEVPLGSGLFIMAAAGAGYALKKRKNNKKQ